MTDLRRADGKDETTLRCETKSTGVAIVSDHLPGTSDDGVNVGLWLSPGRRTSVCPMPQHPSVGMPRPLNPSKQPKCIF